MVDDFKVPPCRPYIVRAMYDWMVDNRMTPQISVNVNYPDVSLPLQYAQNGMIILNISPLAVHNLVIDNEAISFSARFGGVPHDVYVPMISISTIYPREAPSLGMYMFPEKAYDDYYENRNNRKTKDASSHLSAVDQDNSLNVEQETQKSNHDLNSTKGKTEEERKKPIFEIVE
ncbi:MAG: ClpXP protease specificity-enhancing factor [Succinivibrionaceae bacterium]